MTSKGEETKRRLIETTVDLIKIKGYNGVGLQEIIRKSGTPKGSLYFHFPGGKEELVASALQVNGREIESLFRQVLQSTTSIRKSMRTIIDFFINELKTSDFRKGCPVAMTTTDVSSFSEQIQNICKENFKSWESTLCQGLQNAGIDAEEADSLATLFIASVEGAVVLSQAYRDTEPLRRVADRIMALLPK